MVFGKQELPDVETIAKGSVVELTGRIRNNRYTDAHGVEHTVNEIIVQDFKVL